MQFFDLQDIIVCKFSHRRTFLVT